MAQGIIINSINFSGESVDITFNPYSGGSINLGTQTIPYNYLSSNYEGNYSIYISSIPKTCELQVGTPPSPTPTPTPSITPTITPTPSVTVTPTMTMTPTPTPTPPPAGDPDANAYLADVVAAGGTTDATIDAAVNTLFVDLKSNGLYNSMYFYPFVGGTAASHAIIANRSQSTYDMTWNGGIVHDVSGATMNGTNGYGSTGLNRTIWSNLGDVAFGAYLNGDGSAINKYDMGTSSVDDNIFISRWGSSTLYVRFNGGFVTGSNPVTANGMYGITLTGNPGNVKVRKNASTFIANSTTNDGDYNTNIQLVGKSTGNYSIRTFAFVFYSTYFTDSQIDTLSTIINDFQTSLGRNIY